jgi:hypothetical protein
VREVIAIIAPMAVMKALVMIIIMVVMMITRRLATGTAHGRDQNHQSPARITGASAHFAAPHTESLSEK